MIAFGSQRGNGADLAVHLTNAEDNEFVELSTFGFLADDAHGAFSEAEAQAYAMTKLEKYLYSLSINPDPRQPWTTEMYTDYINRAAQTLGLQDQPHVTAKHIKEGADGFLREHMHVVWSRVDVQNSRGINISYDRLKLMQLAREFAQDHDLTLPDGYHHIEQNHEQTSLYEKVKEIETGISKMQHKEVVTDLWRRSDSAKAFVAALEDHGYMLASGKRPYVLVDTFGKMHALPRLIDDKRVRTQDVEDFLRPEFPPESLSTVDEARAVAAQHEESRKRIELSQKLKEQSEILKQDQDARREKLQAEVSSKEERLRQETTRLSDRHGDTLYAHKLNIAQQDMEINFKRAAHAPTGLAAFLSRVTGMDAVRSKYHAYQDKKRETIQEQQRLEIEQKQQLERLQQQHEHQLEVMELRRRENDQAKSFKREQRSIAMAQEREKAAHYSKGYEHMPSVQLALKPPGRMAVTAKAQRRHYAPTVKEENVKAPQSNSQSERGTSAIPSVLDDFSRASEPDYKAHSGSDEFIVPETDKEKGRGR